MPLYEFICASCRHHFEELCSQLASEQMRCPKCGAPAKRQISGFAFKNGNTFKGSGSGCSGCGSGSCSSCGH